MFDLPVESSEDRRNYQRFHKEIVREGFIMLQKSIYCRMLINFGAEVRIEKFIMEHKPPKGVVQLLIITEKQFSKMKYIVGKNTSETIDTAERLLVI